MVLIETYSVDIMNLPCINVNILEVSVETEKLKKKQREKIQNKITKKQEEFARVQNNNIYVFI